MFEKQLLGIFMAKYVCKKMSTTYIKSSYKGIINPLNIKSTGDHTHTHTRKHHKRYTNGK